MLEINFALMKLKDARVVAFNMDLVTFEWRPCNKCSCTTRLSSNGQCANCNVINARRKAPISNKARSELRSSDVYFRVRCDALVFVNAPSRKHALPKFGRSNRAFWRDFRNEFVRLFSVKHILTFVTGLQWECDHITAIEAKSHWQSWLHGETIACGVHAPWNVWILPKRINRAKGCNFDEDLSVPHTVLEVPYFREEDVIEECLKADPLADAVAILAKVKHYIQLFETTGKLPQ